MDTDPAAVARRLHEFRDRCAALGVALTPQRLAIYAALAADPSHPTAEDVFRRVKPDVPSLSLGTVYRTLDLLEREGLVTRVPAGDDSARFDANLDPHHHLVCVRCRQVRDVHAPELDRLDLRADGLHGFRVLNYQVRLAGVCPACQDG